MRSQTSARSRHSRLPRRIVTDPNMPDAARSPPSAWQRRHREPTTGQRPHHRPTWIPTSLPMRQSPPCPRRRARPLRLRQPRTLPPKHPSSPCRAPTRCRHRQTNQPPRRQLHLRPWPPSLRRQAWTYGVCRKSRARSPSRTRHPRRA